MRKRSCSCRCGIFRFSFNLFLLREKNEITQAHTQRVRSNKPCLALPDTDVAFVYWLLALIGNCQQVRQQEQDIQVLRQQNVMLVTKPTNDVDSIKRELAAKGEVRPYAHANLSIDVHTLA
jgi:hypothetical protein